MRRVSSQSNPNDAAASPDGSGRSNADTAAPPTRTVTARPTCPHCRSAHLTLVDVLAPTQVFGCSDCGQYSAIPLPT
jgi:transcription elongation factor Elf1